MKTPTIKDIRAAAASRRARRVRNRRLLVGAVGALVALMVVSIWVVPVVLRGQIEQRASAALKRPVSVARVGFNPLQLAVTIEQLKVTEADGSAWLGWERLRVNLQAWALVRGALGFDEIELDGFEGRVAIDEAGRLNFADLLSDGEEREGRESVEPTEVLIQSLVVRDARIAFQDASHGGEAFVTTLGPVSFSLTGFHTVGDPRAPYDFVAKTEAGESLRWRGTLSAAPLRSQGIVELAGLPVAKYAPYYRAFTQAEVRGGSLQIRSGYSVAVTDEGVALNLNDGQIVLDGLAIAAAGSPEPLIQSQRLQVEGIALDWGKQELAMDSAMWTGGRVRLERSSAGINLVNLFAAPASVASTDSTESPASGLRVRIGRSEVTGLQAEWRDTTLAEPASLSIETLSAMARELDSQHLDRMVQMGVEAVLANEGGSFKITGETGLVPFRPALELRVDRVALAAGGAYIRDASGYVMPTGLLSLTGALGSANGALVFRGDAAVNGARILSETGDPLAAWETLSTEGVSLVLEPLTVEVETVRWVRPDLSVRVAKDGSLNWASPASAGKGPVIDVPAPEVGTPPVVRVNRVELVEARIDFADASLVRPAGTTITDLSGELTGLSSVELAKGKANLRGKANGSALVSIVGDFNPLGRPAYTDLRIDLERVDLSPLNGYVSHYAGYALQRGRLTLDIDFKLKDRAISSETVATLDGFTLGAKVDSPDATGLPVPLALKLLRDGKGQIVIDVPVAGELDDPEFRIGRVVWRVIGNLLTKAATAPFALLGSVLGGGAPDDLDEQVFAAASAELSPEAIQKLDTLAQALAARPDLVVGIRGEYEAEGDAAAWRPLVLETRLRERASGTEWSAETGWVGKARTGHLVNLYLDVFGEPPIDPTRSVAPNESPSGLPRAAPVAPGNQVERSVDDTFVGWLRRVLGGAPKNKAQSESPPSGSDAIPSLADPPSVVVILPDDEIARRLIGAVQIEESELMALAQARAEAVRGHLIGAGVSPTRLVLEQVLAGSTRVTLDLR